METEDLTKIWPCFLCSKMLVNSGVTKIVMRTGPAEYVEMDPEALYRMRSDEALGEGGG